MKQTLIKLGAATMLTLSILPAFAKGGKDETSRKLLDPANIDQSVKPGDNFYRYANGSWLKSNAIPPSETRWGSFNELQENNYQALLKLLTEAAANKSAAAGSADQKIGDFYRTGMDSAGIERAGLKPLQADFARIDAIKDKDGVLKEVALEHTMGIGPLFSFGVGPDDKNVSHMMCQFGQGGLGMPDRDYYTKSDPRTTKIRDAYRDYLGAMFTILGDAPQMAKQHTEEVFRLELALANASMTRVEMRDPYKTYNKFSIREINSRMPEAGWMTLLTNLKIKGEDSVLVGQPLFFEATSKLLNSTSMDTWNAYLKFHLLNNLAPFLYSRADEARFAFYGRTVRGQQAQKPRWKRVLTVIDGSIGELLGQLYVERNFKPEAKARMLALVNNLQQTYADRIKRLDWMSEGTKQRALVKLNAFMKKIGYPDKWRDYSTLRVNNTDYVANVKAASQWEYNYEISKLGRPVDRAEWGMTPPTVNAYYNPAFNEIVFPAGILQYPFFEFSADDAVNYGGIGAVIGHEMTHGFDDQGRQYDADGNLHDWWTKEDADKFTQKTNVVVNQFNSYTVLDTVHVNGELTLGENLADLGGLTIAYEAFHKTKQGMSTEKVDGFNPDQRFFLSWAQVWRANTRPEEMATRIMTDPHSPNELRCNGPLSNMQEFYNAFNVKPGDKMYREPAARAKVW